MTLGEQIRQARENKNLSQEELASQLGVSRQAVSKWEMISLYLRESTGRCYHRF